MAYQSEAQLEEQLVNQLEKQNYMHTVLADYNALINNFRMQFGIFNKDKLAGKPLSEKEWERILNYVNGKSVFESAKILRDKFQIERDDGTKPYFKLLSNDFTENIYQVTHQVTGLYTNRYDVTLLDRRIQKQRQLVERLKTYKRGVLKQYFSAQKDNTKWTKTTISNCLFYEQPQKYIVHSEHYSNTYETPVLTANKAFILGYTNELDGIYDKGDVLIYDDFTMEVKYVDFPFKVKSSTIKMLTLQSGIDLYFMFTLLKSLGLQPKGHQRSYISILEPMEVNIPCYEEQTIASRIFRLLDKQIEKEQQLLHKILDFKSSLLQKMLI